MEHFPAADLLWLIPALPLAGFLVNGLLALLGSGPGPGPHRGLVGTIGTLAPAASFFLTLATLAHFNWLQANTVKNEVIHQVLWTWIDAGSWQVAMGFRFDQLSALMLLFVLGIGSLIHLYSIGYMAQDRGFARFFAYLNLFIASMVVLVLADNLLLTFLGWEGVGLCSYLLIGFWHHDHANNDAARKAFVVNRIGDLGLLLGLGALVAAMVASGHAPALDYATIAIWAQGLDPHHLDAGVAALLAGATLLLFVGCAGKSAQLPLATWLPDAMAGPTPVSALIHAATMVTAGVFLCARLGDVFVLTPATLSVILVVALVTSAWAAVVGLVQWDIKKILAYSTVSQLGFMFMAVGVGAFDVALFHVFTHAFFKATLFLGAGSVIHALHHEQDTRRMGGLQALLPATHLCLFAAWFAIVGLPGGSGFMSKDLILERLAFAPGLGAFSWLAWLLALAVAALTALYMTRFMWLVFWSPERPGEGAHEHHRIEPVPVTMQVPVVLLALGSLLAGGAWIGLVPGADLLHQWLEPVLGHAQELHAGRGHDGGHAYHPAWGVQVLLALAGVGLAVVGIVVARSWWSRGVDGAKTPPLAGLPDHLTNGPDRASTLILVRPLQTFGRVLDEAVDGALHWCLAVLAEIVAFVGSGYQGFQRSSLRASLAISAGGVVIVLLLVFRDLLPGLGS